MKTVQFFFRPLRLIPYFFFLRHINPSQADNLAVEFQKLRMTQRVKSELEKCTFFSKKNRFLDGFSIFFEMSDGVPNYHLVGICDHMNAVGDVTWARDIDLPNFVS